MDAPSAYVKQTYQSRGYFLLCSIGRRKSAEGAEGPNGPSCPEMQKLVSLTSTSACFSYQFATESTAAASSVWAIAHTLQLGLDSKCRASPH